jgi:pyrroloquinoline quinone biosynthesis protein E
MGDGKPSAKMWTLVQRANCHNLLAHVDLAARLGFQHLVFSMQMHGWGDKGMEKRNKDEMVSLPEAHLRRLVERGYEVGVRVAFWDVAEKFDEKHKCPWPFSRAVVTSDLRTVPCCMIGDPDKYEIGKGLTFMQAWKSDEYKAFRQAHREMKIPEVCKGCYK